MEVIKECKRILSWLNQYSEETNCKGVVLGLSGGKDSTVVAMLAKKVWGNNVVAILMPNGEQKDIEDSINIAKSLGIKQYIINISNAYQSLINEVETCIQPVNGKAKTNIPPRLRMTTLYAIAQTLGYRVIGTGNKSEAYIGWTTKWGDSACDFNPIAHLTCSEVIELGKYLSKEFNLNEKFVTKPPSDGLCGKSDEDSFGFTYAQLDEWITNKKWEHGDELAQKIEVMHARSEHKRRTPYTVDY